MLTIAGGVVLGLFLFPITLAFLLFALKAIVENSNLFVFLVSLSFFAALYLLH